MTNIIIRSNTPACESFHAAAQARGIDGARSLESPLTRTIFMLLQMVTGDVLLLQCISFGGETSLGHETM